MRSSKYKNLSDRLERNSREDASGCRIWIGGKSTNGYGRFMITDERGKRWGQAHRAAWELANGPIPSDRPCILHHCDTPHCINPDHLFPGTQLENIADMVAKGRNRRGTQLYWNVKLTEDQVRSIREEHDSQSAIAKKYAVSRSLVGLIRQRKIWKHVE